MTDRVEAKLKELEIQLPSAPAPVGYYVPAIKTGNLAITSGQLPVSGTDVLFTGKVGSSVGELEAHNAARLCALNALAQLKVCLGSLDKITRIIRVEGYVQSAPGFSAQAGVVNGASRLMVDIFGEAGKHSRIAVGVAELPLNAAVEVCIWAEFAE